MYANVLCLLLTALGGASCPLPDARAGTALAVDTIKGYVVTEGDEQLVRFAPIFLVEEYDNRINRIGTPAARYDEKGGEVVYVDPGTATYYTQVIPWKDDSGDYTNLVYRVHFEASKSNSYSTDGGKGDNTGLLAVVTLDHAGNPILFNTVGTCGCFHAILPTTFLPASAYPEQWDTEEYSVYREHLPGLLKYPEDYDAFVRPVVYLRADSHRVADVQVASIDSVREHYELLPAALAPADALKHLPLGHGETSFFFEEGKNKGLVKGAIKKKESVLLGAVIGDLRVGQDRIYGDEDEVDRGFYTTINPFKKDASDMWDYAAFLKQNGWRL